MIVKYYDALALAHRIDELLDGENKIIVSSIAIKALQDWDSIINTIAVHPEIFEVCIFHKQMLEPFKKIGINDEIDPIKELACAYYYDCYKHPDETIFVTCNPALGELANKFFGEDSIEIIS